MPATEEKSYSSVEDLKASDEYKDLGVLGRDRLIAKHFPESVPFSGQRGQRKLVGKDKTLYTEPAGSGSHVGPDTLV